MGERQRYPLGFANNLRLNQDFPQPVFPSRFVLPGPLGTPDYDQAMRLATRRQETGSPMGSGLMSPVPPWWYQPRTKPKRKYKFPDNVPQGPIDEPLWLKFACNEERWDVHELPTWGHNHPRILAYINSVPYMRTTEYKYKHGRKMLGSGHMMGDLDETPWCACFVNWCLKKAGIKAPNYGRAKDWIKYGTVLEHKDVKRGAIAIL